MARYQRSEHSKVWVLFLLSQNPIAGQTISRDLRELRWKENSSRGWFQGDRGILCYHVISTSVLWNVNHAPFRGEMRKSHAFQKGLTQRLGTTYPCPNAVHMETLSTSAFKHPLWIIATTTKIFTSDCWTMSYLTSCFTITTPSYSLNCNKIILWKDDCINWQWTSLGVTLKRHPFSGLVHSAGELLHTP